MTESVKIDRQELKERNGRDFQDRETGERDRRERQDRDRSFSGVGEIMLFYFNFDLLLSKF